MSMVMITIGSRRRRPQQELNGYCSRYSLPSLPIFYLEFYRKVFSSFRKFSEQKKTKKLKDLNFPVGQRNAF